MMRFAGILFFIPMFFQFGAVSQDPNERGIRMAPPWVQSIDVLESTQTGRVYSWNILSATSYPKQGPPSAGLRDLANVEEPSLLEIHADIDSSTMSSPEGPLVDSDLRANGQGGQVPAFWESVAPATYTIEFATPFELHQIDLTSPLRKIGFSDVQSLVKGATSETYHRVTIEEATTARGPTLDSGYRWEFRLRPEKVLGVRFEFRKGTLEYPNRIFLKDLDLWGN